jgi:hypothetical protein
MALQSASTSHTNSTNSLTGLTYVNSVITGATVNGLFSVNIDGNYINDTVTGSILAQGYNITKRNFDIGTYPTYVISW